MPSTAAIVVKKNDNATDITYDAISGSGGDNSPAVWRQDTGAPAGLPVGQRPMLKLTSSWNGPKTGRKVAFRYEYPYSTQDSTTTRYSAKDRVVLDGVITLPQEIPDSVINEAVAQGINLLDSTLVVSSMKAGYAPT